MDSVIYCSLKPDVAAQCGYFEPKVDFARIVKNWQGVDVSIDAHTQVIYFPGSFGTFHEGHASICRAALAKYPNAVLVIAPANSDYTVEKYGAWSEKASNKHRYDSIRRMMPEAVIDIEPMLNFSCDHNFTDLLDSFLDSLGLSLFCMRQTPIILCGKDRADFLKLNEHTKHVHVEYFDDTTGLSTSATLNVMRQKKHLLLRCKTRVEYELFCAHFEDQYHTIAPLLLDVELAMAADAVQMLNLTHTICKEYAHLLPYIKVSRTFTNPLDDAWFPETYNPGITADMAILDSDIYSGATRNFIVDKCGALMVAVMNFERLQDTYELLDISDFRKPNFAYPWVDISSRCSMQAFDHEFHQRFNAFKEALNHE